MSNRIYVVSELADDGKTIHEHLVRAASAAQAVRHIASPKFVADLATQDSLVRLASSGTKVLEATA